MVKLFASLFVALIFFSCHREDSYPEIANKYHEAFAAYSTDDFNLSNRLLDNVIHSYSKENAFQQLGESYYLRGYNYINLLFIDSAIISFYKSQDYFGLAKNEKRLADVTGEIGSLCAKNWAFDIAKVYYEDVLIMSENINDKRLRTSAYNNIGYCMRMMGEYLEAYTYLGQARDLELELDDNPEYLANIYLEQGLCQFKVGNNSIASELFWKALIIGEEHNLLNTVGKANLDIGEVKLASGELDKAEEHLNIAIDALLEGSRDRTLVMVNLGRLNYKKGNFSKSLDYYSQALEGDPHNIDLYDAKIAYDSLTNYYRKRGMIDSAYIYANKMVQIIKNVNDSKEKIDLTQRQYLLRGQYYHREHSLRRQKKERDKAIAYTTLIIVFLCTAVASIKFWDSYSIPIRSKLGILSDGEAKLSIWKNNLDRIRKQ